MTKILITNAVDEINGAGLAEIKKQMNITIPDHRLSREEVLGMLPDYDAIILARQKADKEFIDAASKLKMIVTPSAGFDSIDVDYATSKGIYVANSPAAVCEPTVEITLGLILTLLRKIIPYDHLVRISKWINRRDYGQMGTGLMYKTLGIYGMGRIGQSIARKAKMFGMKIIYHNRREIAPHIAAELDATYVSFSELLTRSDVISINAPLLPETHHKFDYAAFCQMKSTAFLINTGRGPVVKEADLCKALLDKKIAGAGLDVFEFESKVNEQLKTLFSHRISVAG